ncbi:hypothetical protein HCN44_002214 [Aphidius gifuensis]|uniref:RNA methyltransferase n=1 Tax=Aphidius gifuensis TaxID=684658 RepID=A0A834XZQ6_APHGI|nr:hypothetical protein HCN44_002214 [Aphidius gifuensis]
MADKHLNNVKSESLNFKGGEPGASRHGNFINYYNFHSADERIQQLPQGVWQTNKFDRKYIALDVGCNAGNLTVGLWNYLANQLPDVDVNMLGVDLDGVLIERARDSNENLSISYKCLDVVSDECDKVLNDYLKTFERNKFDVIFCFSITMWIHLNNGDEGLVEFIKKICSLTDMVVIEPQPWKCYRNASRRLRKSGNHDDFPLFKLLKIQGDMNKWIEDIICGEDCGFKRLLATNHNTWGRKVLIFQKNHNNNNNDDDK